MPRPKLAIPKANYSAQVAASSQGRLDEIQRTYGASPSGIASLLLQTVANIGAEHYPDFMQEVRALEAKLIAKR